MRRTHTLVSTARNSFTQIRSKVAEQAVLRGTIEAMREQTYPPTDRASDIAAHAAADWWLYTIVNTTVKAALRW